MIKGSFTISDLSLGTKKLGVKRDIMVSLRVLYLMSHLGTEGQRIRGKGDGENPGIGFPFQVTFVPLKGLWVDITVVGSETSVRLDLSFGRESGRHTWTCLREY